MKTMAGTSSSPQTGGGGALCAATAVVVLLAAATSGAHGARLPAGGGGEITTRRQQLRPEAEMTAGAGRATSESRICVPCCHRVAGWPGVGGPGNVGEGDESRGDGGGWGDDAGSPSGGKKGKGKSKSKSKSHYSGGSLPHPSTVDHPDGPDGMGPAYGKGKGSKKSMKTSTGSGKAKSKSSGKATGKATSESAGSGRKLKNRRSKLASAGRKPASADVDDEAEDVASVTMATERELACEFFLCLVLSIVSFISLLVLVSIIIDDPWSQTLFSTRSSVNDVC